MRIIKGVLKEELSNSLQMKEGYEKAISKLPKGSLLKKEIRGHHYYYIAFREKDKVRYIYKGKVSERYINKYEEAKVLKQKYRKLLSQSKKQIKFLKRALNGKEAV